MRPVNRCGGHRYSAVDAAVVEAERLLADRTHFVLEADQWSRFVELLDRSPQDNPGLEKLFAKPGVFAAE